MFEQNVNRNVNKNEYKKEMYTKIAKRLKVYHYIKCQHHSTCRVCSNGNFINTTFISKENENDWYSELYYLYKESKIVVNQFEGGISNNKVKYSNKNYRYYLIKLFLSKINHKTFSFFKYFYTLTEDKYVNSPTLLKNNLHFLFSNEEITEDPSTHIFLQEMMRLSKFNVNLKTLLINFLTYINQDFSLKTADHLLQLSKQINEMKNELECVIELLDNKQFIYNNSNNHHLNTMNITKEQLYSKDQAKRYIQSSCKYNLTISRYILESLINKSFNNLNPLNIELFEDYLTMHFHFDKIMILSTYIKGSVRRGNKCIFDTIKITGFSGQSVNAQYNMMHTYNGAGNIQNNYMKLMQTSYYPNGNNTIIDDKKNTIQQYNEEEYSQFTFSELFPKKLKDIAENKLHKLVTNYKGNDIGVFEFVIENQQYLQYIKYLFELSQTLIDDKLIIYGYYSSPYEKIILIKYNDMFYNQEDMFYKGKIISYSRAMAQILIIKPYLYEVIKTHLNHSILLSDVFTAINVSNKNDIICEISYKELLKNTIWLFEKLLQLKLSSNEIIGFGNIENDITKMKDVFKDRENLSFYMKLNKLLDIDSSYVLYNVSFLNKNKCINKETKNKHTTKNTKHTKHTKQHQYNISFDNEYNDEHHEHDEQNQTNENVLKEIKMNTISSFSVTDNSMSEKVSNLQNNNKKQEKDISSKTTIIRKETNKLKIVSLIILIINLFLICLCIIFLIIQISKTNQIKQVNDLYLSFKIFRLTFTNVVSSIIKLICLMPSTSPSDKCVQFYKDYLHKYQYEILNFTAYELNEFLTYELKNKIDYFQTTYYDLKKQIYNINDDKFLQILNEEVIYISFEQHPDFIGQNIMNDIFGNAIKTYINSMLVLIG